MKTGNKLVIGALAGLGAAWGAREWMRSRRRISLKNRVIIMTGASTGHGLIAARYAAQQGARLVIAARESEDLHAAEAELSRIDDADVMAVATDVRDREQCRQLVQQAIARHGRVDILVNNAGIIQVGPLEAMTLEDFEAALATNFWGALYCTLEVLPIMREQLFGRIANVVSVGGKVAVPHLAPYSVSKFALTGLTKSLRIELAKDNILVTGVYPGTMRTGGHTHAWMKGQQASEYTWFALGDSLPLISVSAEHVARAMWRAVCDGDAEANVSWQTQVTTTLDAIFPNWNAEALALIARLLPPAGGPSEEIQGQNIPGTIPSLLTAAIPSTARPQIAS